MNMNKIVRIGIARPQGRSRGYSIFCRIEIKDGRLSITGVEGPNYHDGCAGSCGQIIMSTWPITEYAPGWDEDKVTKFREVWDRWHLNDMRAGTPAQEALLESHAIKGYDNQCAFLKEHGLYVDNGHRYGMAWFKEELPEGVIEFLASLPDADRKPAWV